MPLHLFSDYRLNSLLSWIHRWLPLFWGGSFILLSVGIFFSLFASPEDYQQGHTVRIMYIHVPCSWGAMATYFAMSLIAIWGFVKQLPIASLLIKAMAPIGFYLCLISLVTGSIWGKPTWGTWWVWDARLTSMLVLALLYLTYLFLSHKGTYQQDKIAGLIVILGSLNLPIIKWSVDWWHTLHQPASLMRFGQPAIHWQMMIPLLTMTLGIAFFSFTLFLIQLRSEVMEKRLLAFYLRKS